MSKFPVKKIELDGFPVTEAQAHDRFVLLKFKSGKIYRFDANSYRDAVNSVFSSHQKFPVRTSEQDLLQKVNSVIEKNENQNRSVIKLSSVLVEFGDLNDEWFNMFEPAWNDIISDLSIAMNDAEHDTVYPMIANSIIRTMSLPYTETMVRLDVSDIRRVQTAATGLEDFPLAYFYTDFDVRNGCEIWRKAVDPIILFGTPVESFD